MPNESLKPYLFDPKRLTWLEFALTEAEVSGSQSKMIDTYATFLRAQFNLPYKESLRASIAIDDLADIYENDTDDPHWLQSTEADQHRLLTTYHIALKESGFLNFDIIAANTALLASIHDLSREDLSQAAHDEVEYIETIYGMKIDSPEKVASLLVPTLEYSLIVKSNERATLEKEAEIESAYLSFYAAIYRNIVQTFY